MRECETINDEGILCWMNEQDPHPDLFSYHDDIRERYLKNPKQAEADQDYRTREQFYAEMGYELPIPCRFLKLNHSFEQKFGDNITVQPEFRMLDDVAFAVVSISSFIDNVRLFTCSGTVIETTSNSAAIVTSACLVAVYETDGTRKFAQNVKINVRFVDGSTHVARLIGCCLHYNVAFVEVEKCVQVYLPLEGEVMESIPDVVYALGCHYVSREFMAARGKILLKSNRFDCPELMFSSCKITKCGIGGPLVTSGGDLAGVNFYDENDTPYLPSVLVSKCWEHIKTSGRVHHLYFGWVIRPFRTLTVEEWWSRQCHAITESLPLVDDGLLVEEVRRNSPAHKSGILEGDIVLDFFGEPVVTFPAPKYAALLLDKSKTMLEKKVDEVQVRILRQNYHSRVKKVRKRQMVSITSSQKADPKQCKHQLIYAAELSSHHFNRWPLPQPKWAHIPGPDPMVAVINLHSNTKPVMRVAKAESMKFLGINVIFSKSIY